MKVHQHLRSLLGITQQEMASLLKISRSQLALYETGRRSLPMHTTAIIAELIAHLPAQSNEKTLPLPDKAQLQKRQKLLDGLVRENEIQRMRTVRKIEAIQKKQAAQQKAVTGASIVNSLTAKRGETNPVHEFIAMKGRQKQEEDYSDVMMVLEIRLDVIAFERKQLELKVKDVGEALSKNKHKSSFKV